MEFGHQEFSVRFLKAFFKMSFNAPISSILVNPTNFSDIFKGGAQWSKSQFLNLKFRNYRVSQYVSDNFVDHFWTTLRPLFDHF